MSGSRIKIEALEGEKNWSAWRTLIQDVIWTIEGLSHLTEEPLQLRAGVRAVAYQAATQTTPEVQAVARVDPITQTMVDDWEKKDMEVLVAIRTRVGSDIVVHVQDCDYAKDAWNALLSLYARKSIITLLYKKREFSTAQYNDGEDMVDFIKKLRSLYNEIKTIPGAHIEEHEFAITLLTALPKTWDGINQGIDLDYANYSGSEGTGVHGWSAMVQARVLAEAGRQKGNAGDSAMAVWKGKGRFQGDRGKASHARGGGGSGGGKGFSGV